jgi:hypothetical protein
MADIVDIVNLVEADINRVIRIIDGIYISLIRGLRRIYFIILN